jgi:hypothetical protein
MGNPFAYASQEQVEAGGDEDAKRMVTQYDPTHELILVLLKSGDRTSTYRVGVLPPGPQETVAGKVTQGRAGEPAAGLKLDIPDVETLMEWEVEGSCEAADNSRNHFSKLNSFSTMSSPSRPRQSPEW